MSILEEFDKFTLQNKWAGKHYNELKFMLKTAINQTIENIKEAKEINKIIDWDICSKEVNEVLDKHKLI